MKFPQLDPKFVMYSSMGMELGLSVVVGAVIGSYLDDYFDTQPWLLLTFMLCGIIAGYRSLFRLMKKTQADSKSQDLPPSS